MVGIISKRAIDFKLFALSLNNDFVEAGSLDCFYNLKGVFIYGLIDAEPGGAVVDSGLY